MDGHLEDRGPLCCAHWGKIGVPPRDGEWETVDSWENPGAPGGKHPAPTVRHGQHPRISSREKFEFIPVSEYDEVWNDRGSGANQDVSIWRVRVPHGCHLDRHDRQERALATDPSDAGHSLYGSQVAPPERFDLVWWQERGRRRFWCWRPIPPPGYVSLGDVGGRLAKPRHQERRLFAFPRAASARAVSLWVVRFGTTEEEARQGTRRSLNSREARGSSDVVTMVPTTSLTESFQYLHIPRLEPPWPMRQMGLMFCKRWLVSPFASKSTNVQAATMLGWESIHQAQATRITDLKNKRWKWLRNIDVNNASFSKRAVGDWSIRVFSDGGYKLHERKDFVVRRESPNHLT